MAEVVSAIIVRDGRILLTQRRPEKDFGLTWESPGGKVDPAESHHQALRRELREELGVEAKIIAELCDWIGEFRRPMLSEDRQRTILSFYRVKLAEGADPRPLEGQGLGWFTVGEMCALSLAPANVRAIREITLAIEKAPGWMADAR